MPRKKLRIYKEGWTEEAIMDAEVFLCLRGACHKADLKDTLGYASDIDAAMRMVAGTARSMGIVVEE